MTVPQPNRLYKCAHCNNVIAHIAPPDHCYMCDIIDRMNGIIHRTPVRMPNFMEIKVISTSMREE